MEKDEFQEQLNHAQDLMSEEKFSDALKLLERLKDIEQKMDFDYNLTHKFFQLLSNCKSLYNQQIILKSLNKAKSQNTLSITFQELKTLLKDELNIEESILGREVELLILRGVLSCKLEGDKIIF